MNLYLLPWVSGRGQNQIPTRSTEGKAEWGLWQMNPGSVFLFAYFWLCWVFAVAWVFSPAAAGSSGCTAQASPRHGLSRCGARA